MSRTARRLNPDALFMLIFAVVASGTVAFASFLWSWDALVDVAPWAGVQPSRAWVAPVVVDGALLAFTVAVLVRRARDETARLAWFALTLFTVVSVAFNAAHGWTAGTGADGWQRIAGAFLAALAPIAVLLATHTLAHLLVQPSRPVDPAEAFVQAAEAMRPKVEAAIAEEVRDAEPVPALEPEPEPEPEPTPLLPAPEPEPEPRRRGRAERDAEILRLAEEGLSTREIEDRMGVSKSTAARVIAEARLREEVAA